MDVYKAQYYKTEYTGTFNDKGEKHGDGTLTYFYKNNIDEIVYGHWYKDKLDGFITFDHVHRGYTASCMYSNDRPVSDGIIINYRNHSDSLKYADVKRTTVYMGRSRWSAENKDINDYERDNIDNYLGRRGCDSTQDKSSSTELTEL